MNALIHIEIIETTDFTYAKPLITWAKSEFKNIATFDLDNHSDPTLFQYASTLIEKEEKVIIYMDIKNEAGSGKFLGLAEKIIQNKEKCLMIMKGESKLLQKMFSLLKQNFIQANDSKETEELMRKFLI